MPCTCRGIPIVTTSAGLRGLGVAPQAVAMEQVLLVADTPKMFAEAVVRLCTDEALWHRLSRGGLEHVRAMLSPDALAHHLKAAIGVD
jgi:O-antigen biosynthesis protein